jgi:hypothetical protein
MQPGVAEDFVLSIPVGPKVITGRVFLALCSGSTGWRGNAAPHDDGGDADRPTALEGAVWFGLTPIYQQFALPR